MYISNNLHIILGILNIICISTAQPYLSNLSATKNDPLYTTYAASIERSEYILDEGYQFVWYDFERGINFETDNAGQLCLAFKMGGEIVYYLPQVHTEPVVTASYNDLVCYYFYPFENLRVEIFFLVYTSRIAIQQIKLINESNLPVTIDVYPFIYHEHDFLYETGLIYEQDGFVFRHREPPDGWTIAHNIPYQENVYDAFVLDTVMDAWGGYADLGTLPVPRMTGKNQSSLPANYCVEWGLVNHSDGSLCFHTPPQAQQIILHNGSDLEILTEQAPKWGDPDPNIPGNGYQGCELGHFDNPPISPGDSFRVIFSCLATGEQGSGTGTIPAVLPAPTGVNLNIQLQSGNHPAIPQNLQATFAGGTAYLHWNPVSNATYSVYRRTVATDTGEYDRLAEGLTDTLWYDFTISPNEKYGYIVAARDGSGNFSGHSPEVNNIETSLFFADIENDYLNQSIPSGNLKIAAMQKRYDISPGQTRELRIVRGVTTHSDSLSALVQKSRSLMTLDLASFILQDEQIYSGIPQLNLPNPDWDMLYWTSFALMRQCMLPPENECSYNYYVFSREPTWGWGHGGQVFHESLTMLAYAFMDPVSAINSQRAFIERQWPDGYINYRTGPYLNETIPFNNQYTTSAPWFNWENLEIFKFSPDTTFLEEAYVSGKLFYQYWLNNRDSDNDGLCEWGAHAVLESVRDGQVAVWDQVGWPDNFECLDLNVMLVNEANSLAEMADILGYPSEYQFWLTEASARKDSINKYMWDDQTSFYYHVDKADHDFTFQSPDDLKRMEIIGFLPLWANIASQQQSQQLIQHLTDPDEFWRAYGIPTLAASDGYYNPMGYWNGPVWVQWQYLIFRGLLNYGYNDLARQLAEKVIDQVIYQLKENHWFWELYSPDDRRAGWNKAYIWSGLVARMLIDLYGPAVKIGEKVVADFPNYFELQQNFPNPFNPVTEIEFILSKRQQVNLIVYDILGRRIKNLVNAKLGAGQHIVTWNGTDELNHPVASGIYFYEIRTTEYNKVKKMILIQ
jgi:hypothetical protein